ncbi:thrombospondin-1-like [Pecten maximus]|uniref:thrombospondin-1-like n=1 Tax=Pecten maximus TaxID=6579 RepID=UPI001458ED59|nr:thrombospondin-1-like [Pecten maximus]
MDFRVVVFLVCVWMASIPTNVKGMSTGNLNEFTYYTFSCSHEFFMKLNFATWYDCSVYNVTSSLAEYLDGVIFRQLYLYDGIFGLNDTGCNGYLIADWDCGQNGGWSTWSSWADCPVICGNASVSRSRSCNNPSWVSPGSDCPGSATETQSCNTTICEGMYLNYGLPRRFDSHV